MVWIRSACRVDRVPCLVADVGARGAAAGRTVNEAIQGNLRAVWDRADRAGRDILAHLNHPNFGSAVTPADLARAMLKRHLEVFHGHPAVNQRGSDTSSSVEMF